uniref:Uncharacterized protein n=1 Tax=Colletotrichum fructicola (strain Nara gc5) TaxID=1213859 RepID=L2FF68_COLFN
MQRNLPGTIPAPGVVSHALPLSVLPAALRNDGSMWHPNRATKFAVIQSQHLVSSLTSVLNKRSEASPVCIASTSEIRLNPQTVRSTLHRPGGRPFPAISPIKTVRIHSQKNFALLISSTRAIPQDKSLCKRHRPEKPALTLPIDLRHRFRVLIRLAIVLLIPTHRVEPRSDRIPDSGGTDSDTGELEAQAVKLSYRTVVVRNIKNLTKCLPPAAAAPPQYLPPTPTAQDLALVPAHHRAPAHPQPALTPATPAGATTTTITAAIAKKKPSFKTTAVLIAAIAVATICIHRVWHKRKHPEVRGPHWDTLNAPGRHSRRRNVVRDRHNGYVPEYDRPPRRLPPRRGPRYYEDESDGYFSDYNPPPRTYRLAEEPRGQRLTEEAIMGPPRDEIVRYAKTSGRSEAESSKRFFDEDNRSRRVEDAVEDWSRRGAARFPSPDGRRPETVYDDRRSRRRSDYY